MGTKSWRKFDASASSVLFKMQKRLDRICELASQDVEETKNLIKEEGWNKLNQEHRSDHHYWILLEFFLFHHLDDLALWMIGDRLSVETNLHGRVELSLPS
eukprot:TRINITY_DN3922_c0_g2_i3.p1 TRINITY_DN3922_c0_g2~~TRINITY_DN3922_c0_g2_i3.p1  ORF type:complete len:101 (-),score=23.73 TRINITY_DN3922_c0_g2_i3:294-596(-)